MYRSVPGVQANLREVALHQVATGAASREGGEERTLHFSNDNEAGNSVASCEDTYSISGTSPSSEAVQMKSNRANTELSFENLLWSVYVIHAFAMVTAP